MKTFRTLVRLTFVLAFLCAVVLGGFAQPVGVDRAVAASTIEEDDLQEPETGRGIGDDDRRASRPAGEAVEDSLDRAGAATREGLDTAGDATANRLEKSAEPVGRGLDRAMDATGRGLDVAMRATGYGIRRAMEWTGGALRRAGDAIAGN